MLVKGFRESMYKRVISTVLLILWMGVIFSFSAQPAAESSKLSGSVREVVVNALEKIFPSLFNEANADNDEEGFLTTLIRKTAHFSLYLILGILAAWTLSSYKIEKRCCLYAFLFCVFYAISDEIHQLFVQGRAGKVADVFIDSIGSAVGIYLRRKIKK